jgi:hypothetical protein
VIIALAESGTAFAYSVPALDLILRLPLQTPLGKVSMDTESGESHSIWVWSHLGIIS